MRRVFLQEWIWPIGVGGKDDDVVAGEGKIPGLNRG